MGLRVTGTGNQRLLCPHLYGDLLSIPHLLLHSTGGLCPELSECKTPAKLGEADSITSMMLGAQTQSKMVKPKFFMFRCWPYYQHHLVAASCHSPKNHRSVQELKLDGAWLQKYFHMSRTIHIKERHKLPGGHQLGGRSLHLSEVAYVAQPKVT